MEVVDVEKEMESIVLPYRDHLSLITFWIFSATYVLCCFSLRTVAFRGHGFSLLEKPTLRGLQTRAIPAGVNGPPLQTPC